MMSDYEDDGLTGVEESRFMTDFGMVVVTRDDDQFWLGMSETSDADLPPQVKFKLTKRQGRALWQELDCWLTEEEAEDDS